MIRRGAIDDGVLQFTTPASRGFLARSRNRRVQLAA
jgi:hypothetical protein